MDRDGLIEAIKAEESGQPNIHHKSIIIITSHDMCQSRHPNKVPFRTVSYHVTVFRYPIVFPLFHFTLLTILLILTSHFSGNVLPQCILSEARTQNQNITLDLTKTIN
ncbi:hypothetical protein VNO77_24601 [Canavalia gladiata]|uniref:Uncharacterized protein n=1 Tax=Canavalia gladiata TaxID=3824 RepID=A0AAN9QCT0_CANGL